MPERPDDFERHLAERLHRYEADLPHPTRDPLATGPTRRPLWIGAAGALAASAVVAGVVIVAPDSPRVAGSTPSPSTAATATASAPSPSSSAAASNWGPLAVIAFTGNEAGNQGTLTITDECVFLERDGQRELLVWPEDRTRWNDDGTISFATIHDGEVTLRPGDYLVLGGGGSSTDEDKLDGREWADSVDWVHPPADACLVDWRWVVTDVSSIGVPTPTPEPSAAAWVSLPIEDEDRDHASLNGVMEWNGRLVAVGRADLSRGAVWWSDDGSTWQEASVPDSPPERAVHLQTPFAIDDRLLAIGILAHPMGSGPIGSVIWTSTDGVTWTDTAASAQVQSAPLGHVGVIGQRIVMAEGHETPAGSAFWVSDDGGTSWQRVEIEPGKGWRVHDGLVHDGRFVAVGTVYEGGANGEAAAIWTSTDGRTWDRSDLGPGRALRIAEFEDGTLHAIGDSEEGPMGWTSADGREWHRSEINLACCGTNFAVTPAGFVTVQGAEDASESAVSTSSDGLTWSVAGPYAGGMRDVTWTETFGVVIHGLDPQGRPAVIVGWESE